METYEFRAMNTNILLMAEGAPDDLKARFMQAEALVRDYEQRFTRFSADSELSALNRSAGRWFQASAELFEVMRLALEAYNDTDGLFNPAILTSLEAAGYDRSMDEIRANGGQAAAAGAETALQPPAADFRQMELDEISGGIYLPEGMRIDLGGIAKGWIAEQVALWLEEFAPICTVSAGGDLFACGRPEGGWQIGLEDPFDPERSLGTITTGPGAVATSTVTKRRWQQGGREQHHLIDPRTGLPAEVDWVSATALCEHAYQAETLAKAMLIAGPQNSAALIGRHPEARFILVDRDRKVWEVGGGGFGDSVIG